MFGRVIVVQRAAYVGKWIVRPLAVVCTGRKLYAAKTACGLIEKVKIVIFVKYYIAQTCPLAGNVRNIITGDYSHKLDFAMDFAERSVYPPSRIFLCVF